MTRRHNAGVHMHPRSKHWCFSYKAPSGKYVHKLTKATSKTEAKAEKIAFLGDILSGNAPTDMAKWTVNRAADHWVELRVAVSGSRRTLAKDRAVMRSLKRELGGRKLEDISNWVLDSHQAKRAKEIGPAQVNREMRYLSILLRKAKLWNRLRDDYKPLRQNAEVAARALTGEQSLFLVEVAASKYDWEVLGWCVILALNTGLRGCEVKQLTLGRIELGDQPALWVRRGTTKTDAGARRVPLNPSARWAVERLQDRARALGSSAPEHYLFPAYRSRHTKPSDPLHGERGFDPTMPQESLRSAWESLRRETAVRWKAKHQDSADDPFSGLHFHDLRHSFITAAGTAGVPIERIMAVVGHMAPAMTRHYMHLRDDATRGVVESVQCTLGMSGSVSPQNAAKLPALRA
jgi:integrase